ncbi:non-hydrolyzing UDP-N-acetylglucosamine 2-epimerase [Leekyejoonella antrihumi]|nr:UDP-N-acetylglucosamine 2-epimerase (non-hydrolyzing) [Leekyejoonella antrihumi]
MKSELALEVRRKVLVVVGTRPEAIKLLPVIRALRSDPRLEPLVVTTGQHPGVVESILGLDGVIPTADIGVGNTARGGLTDLFTAVMTGLEQFFLSQFEAAERPSSPGDESYPVACLVHGDTTSAAAAAMAAFHRRIPVVHVEAGLRTGGIRSPFPEELNRQLISRIATFHVAPTYANLQNLVREGVAVERIFVTGNTAIDALRWAAEQHAPYADPQLAILEDEDTPVVVVTAHRRENWGEGLQHIASAVARLADAYPRVRFVLPLHPDPRVAAPSGGAWTADRTCCLSRHWTTCSSPGCCAERSSRSATPEACRRRHQRWVSRSW